MKQTEILTLLQLHGPMTISDLAEHDGSKKYWKEKKTNINHRLLTLERQRMVCRVGTVHSSNGHEMIVWGLNP